MHILLTTYGLLLIFALYCSAQWRSATDMAFMDIVTINTFARARNEALGMLNDRAKSLYTKYAPDEAQKPGSSKSIASTVDSTKAADKDALIIVDEDEDDEAPLELQELSDEEPAKKSKVEKCTPHLHIGELFTDDNLNITDGKGKACFTLLKNLMISMYGNENFYLEAKEEVPDFEDRFLINLYERTKDREKKVTRVKALATIELDDELQNYVRYKIFNGNKSRYDKDSADEVGYYPLLQFTSITKRKTLLSLWLAPKPLLMALFQNPDVVQEVIEARRDIYNDLRKDKNQSAVTTKENELRLRFSSSIHDIDTQFIDFKVSRTRPPDIPKAEKKNAKDKKSS
jgi:hypothetical protein